MILWYSRIQLRRIKIWTQFLWSFLLFCINTIWSEYLLEFLLWGDFNKYQQHIFYRSIWKFYPKLNSGILPLSGYNLSKYPAEMIEVLNWRIFVFFKGCVTFSLKLYFWLFIFNKYLCLKFNASYMLLV